MKLTSHELGIRPVGFGYEITGVDVWTAFSYTMGNAIASVAGCLRSSISSPLENLLEYVLAATKESRARTITPKVAVQRLDEVR